MREVWDTIVIVASWAFLTVLGWGVFIVCVIVILRLLGVKI